MQSITAPGLRPRSHRVDVGAALRALAVPAAEALSIIGCCAGLAGFVLAVGALLDGPPDGGALLAAPATEVDNALDANARLIFVPDLGRLDELIAEEARRYQAARKAGTR